MAQIDSAYFGDDSATRNITTSLRRKVTGGKLDVTANSELIPAFEAAPEMKIETEDEVEIQKAAIRTCGEGDQTCLESTKARLRQEKLQEKERVSMSTANTVKGRRLTVNLVDKDGKRRTVIVPDGQKLNLEDVQGGMEMTTVAGVKMPSFDFFAGEIGNLATWFGIGLFQAFGLVAFVMMLRDEAPVFWQQYVLEGGWGSVLAGAALGFILFLIPFGPLGLVALFYLGRGIYFEFKK
jgi:hypothetical protein